MIADHLSHDNILNTIWNQMNEENQISNVRSPTRLKSQYGLFNEHICFHFTFEKRKKQRVRKRNQSRIEKDRRKNKRRE